MSKKVWHECIELTPFNYKCYVFVGKNPNLVGVEMQKVLKNHREYWIEEAKEGGNCVFGIVMEDGSNACVMLLSSFDPVFIVHECVHVSWFLNKARMGGIEFTCESQETQAYIVDYLFKTISLLKSKKPIRS